jgi:hypothetical protein
MGEHPAPLPGDHHSWVSATKGKHHAKEIRSAGHAVRPAHRPDAGQHRVAQTHPVTPHPAGFNCNNGLGVNIVTCSNVLNNINIPVIITGNRVLTVSELVKLEDSLNHVDIDLLNIEATLEEIEVVTVDVYDSFNPSIDIDVEDVNVCILAICK